MTEESGPAPSPAASLSLVGSATSDGSQSERDATFDILKGIAIFEVVLLHVCGFSSRNFATKDSWLWWALSMSVAVLQVCVPTFLLSSAIVAAMSASRKKTLDWGAYYGRRMVQTLWPYVLWTFIYLALRYFVAKAPSDLKLESSTIFGLELTTAHVWAPDYVGYTLLWGKSQFHMYFLAVLMQFIALFPIWFLGIRRSNLSLGWLMAIATGLQFGVYWLNANVLYLKTPASTVVWYLVPLTVGIALGQRWRDWKSIWRQLRMPMLAIGIVGGVAYLGLRARVFAGEAVPGWAFNGGFVFYTLALGLATVGISAHLASMRGTHDAPRDEPSRSSSPDQEARSRWNWSDLWSRIGGRSLAIFFIHPIVLQLLGSKSAKPLLDRLPVSPLWTFLIVCGTTWIGADILYRIKLNRFFFGR